MQFYKKRMKRFELSTLSLARRCSTTELHPQELKAMLQLLVGWFADPEIMHHRPALGQMAAVHTTPGGDADTHHP